MKSAAAKNTCIAIISNFMLLAVLFTLYALQTKY